MLQHSMMNLDPPAYGAGPSTTYVPSAPPIIAFPSFVQDSTPLPSQGLFEKTLDEFQIDEHNLFTV
jgi:hypothetical protein